MLRWNCLAAYFLLLATPFIGSAPTGEQSDKDKERVHLERLADRNGRIIIGYWYANDVKYKKAADRLKELSGQFRDLDKDIETAKDPANRKKTLEAVKGVAEEVALARKKLRERRTDLFLQSGAEDRSMFDPGVFIPRQDYRFELVDKTPKQEFDGAILQTFALIQFSDTKYKEGLERREKIEAQRQQLEKARKALEVEANKRKIDDALTALKTELKTVEREIGQRQTDFFRTILSRIDTADDRLYETERLLQKYLPKHGGAK